MTKLQAYTLTSLHSEQDKTRWFSPLLDAKETSGNSKANKVFGEAVETIGATVKVIWAFDIKGPLASSQDFLGFHMTPLTAPQRLAHQIS